MPNVSIKSTNDFSFRNSKEFLDFAKSEDSNLYVFLSKSTSWEDDESPPFVDISQSNLYKIWDDMSIVKKINIEQDVIAGIKRINWEANTVYTAYDDQIDLKDKNFYIFTEENNLYICIDNNNNSVSLDPPKHKNASKIERENDGYRWKFIGEITKSLKNKFIIPGFLPIQANTFVQDSATPGTIDRISIENSGSGYEFNDSLFLFIEGNGDQSQSENNAIIDVEAVQNIIANFSFISNGENYQSDIPGTLFPVAIRQITPDEGVIQNAYGLASINVEGNIQSLKILDRGNGYVDGPAEIIQSSAQGIAQTDGNGSIVSASITKPGENFFKAKCVILTENSNQQITEKAILRPIISTQFGFGSEQLRNLFSHYVLVSVNFLSPARLGIPLEEFRITGIIDSLLPFDYEIDSDGNLPFYTNLIGDAKGKLKIKTENKNFTIGETIVGKTSGAIGTNLAFFRDDILRYTRIDEFFKNGTVDFIPNELIEGKSSGVVTEVLEVSPPEIAKYSGNILSINNINPTDFSNDQNVIITFVIKF